MPSVLRLSLLPFLLIYLKGYAQNQREKILWTGVSAEFHYKKQNSFYEVENSQRSPWQKDYFTVLFNHEWRLKNIKPGIGASYWLLVDEDNLAVPELRPHVQAEWILEKRRFTLLQRTRFENRILRDTLNDQLQRSYSYHLRPRLLFECAYYLIGKEQRHPLQLLVFDEIIANQSRLLYLDFTENRLFGGLVAKIAKYTSLRLGYLWLYSKDRRTRRADILYFTIKNDFHLR